MALRLTIAEDGAPASQYIRTFVQERIVIGRSRSSDICLPDMAVSTRHAEIRVVGRDHVLVDLESLNGSSVNDKPVLAFQQRKLQTGDVIRVASFTLSVELGAGPGKEEQRDASIRQAKEMLRRISERSGDLDSWGCLTVIAGPCRGARFILPAADVQAVIGRGSESNIVLDDRDISRSHAEMAVRDGKITVRDIGSRNGLVVGDVRVNSLELNFGDSFTVGKTTIVVEHPSESVLSTIFEAPEEETSSYEAALRPVPSGMPTLPQSESISTDTVQGHGSQKSSVSENASTLPIGPSDPLVGEAEPPLEKRTVDGVLFPAEKEKKSSDVGLIIIGIVLLVAATSGLAYLFR